MSDRPATDRINQLKSETPVSAARRSQPPRPMPEADLQKLVEDAVHEVLGNGKRIRVLGATEVAGRFLQEMSKFGLLNSVLCVHGQLLNVSYIHGIPVYDFSGLTALGEDEVLVVAADSKKESLLRASLPFIEQSSNPTPKIVLAGYGHYKYSNPDFYELQLDLLVESLANGHPNNLIHIFQCLQNAAKQGLQGDVVEWGCYQGGTSMFISRAMEKLGLTGTLFSFDNFAGFPPRKSLWDLYDDPGCAFASFEDVTAYLSGRNNVKLIPGDIVETASVMDDKPLIFSFIDTDCYTASLAGARIAMNNTVVGGAAIFDHVAGTNRFRYTLGELVAARDSGLMDSPDWFHLHETGVFLKQR